jgi:hypothetical protein
MSTVTVSPLRQRIIEDMNARKLGAHSQRSHIHSCRRFAGGDLAGNISCAIWAYLAFCKPSSFGGMRELLERLRRHGCEISAPTRPGAGFPIQGRRWRIISDGRSDQLRDTIRT